MKSYPKSYWEVFSPKTGKTYMVFPYQWISRLVSAIIRGSDYAPYGTGFVNTVW
jgi:hypothetical protein